MTSANNQGAADLIRLLDIKISDADHSRRIGVVCLLCSVTTLGLRGRTSPSCENPNVVCDHQWICQRSQYPDRQGDGQSD